VGRDLADQSAESSTASADRDTRYAGSLADAARFRVSKAIGLGSAGRIELLFDVLNALNDTAEESIASDDFFSATFGSRRRSSIRGA
jgi:hypothetical protein